MVRVRASGALELADIENSPCSPEGGGVVGLIKPSPPRPPTLLESTLYAAGNVNKFTRSTVIWSVLALHVLAFIVHSIMNETAGGQRVLNWALIVTSGGCFYCFVLLSWCMKPRGLSTEMATVVRWIQEGAEGFYRVQYGAIVILALVTSFAMGLGFYMKSPASYPAGLERLSGSPMAIIMTGSFILGAFCSALSGYIGLWVSVRVNGQVANAARSSYAEALEICFRGGAVCAVTNICLAVGGVSGFTMALRHWMPWLKPQQCAILLSGFSFGASLVAMFAQLGGGIYTKAADIGADLVGKVENSIPEDDPRNPAVIADLVGDNVGDCAGQCADLFESISAEIISAMIIGGALASKYGLSEQDSWSFVLFPLLVHSLDIVVSSTGALWVSAKKNETAESVNPLTVMVQAYAITASLAAVGLGFVCRYCLYIASAPSAWKYYYACTLIGLSVAAGFILVTQYYTDYEYEKVKSIAAASISGPATNIITGLAVGMESTGAPVLMISVAILSSFQLGKATYLTPGSNLDGLFGCAAATMGMLSSAGFILTMSSFGPIADNAGGIVEITGQPDSARFVTDRLDAVGNVTKANTKGFSIGSAALACFLLFSAFIDEVELYSGIKIEYVDITSPDVFVGGILGGMTVFVFAGKAMQAVSRAAQECVKEVRRQFEEYPEILTGGRQADYQACVALSSKAALKEMVVPGVLATTAPVVVGLVFRFIGEARGDRLNGVNALIGFQIFATAVGILMALFLNNAGGAWDNAKKYIESGPMGGKNSPAHHASVVGDTVGDPCKDTAGPSVHVLIKLVCTVSIVLTPIFIGS